MLAVEFNSHGRVMRFCRALFRPSLADLFFAFLLIAMFGRPQAWQALLGDGDTGWHIRTGDYILQTGRVPQADPFSFTRAGQPWFAWEWLSDVIFASLHRWHGLAAVAGLAAGVLGLSAVFLFCWLLRRGSGLWIAVAVTLLAVSQSSIHALARPHIFSLLLATQALWILDEDRRSPGLLLWWLVPLTALWANLHAGFAGWLLILGLLVLVSGIARHWKNFLRYGTLAALCSAATLLNPYGWRLHQHIAQYLGSSWIMEHVQEFQSPSIRSENMIVFALMLLFGVVSAGRPLGRRQWFDGLLVIAWGFAALRSARHVPWYAIVSAPVIASECATWWSGLAARKPARSAIRIFWDLSLDLGRSRHISIWAPTLGALVIGISLPAARLADFPESRFPVAAVGANLNRLVPAGSMPRILTSDQWADYLIFQLYPLQRVFFDGRSDFYGPSVGDDYQALLSVGAGWRGALDRYGFDIALLPKDWALGNLLQDSPDWTVVYRDSISVLLMRRSEKVSVDPKEIRETCRTYICD
ncbi:MAG TPA: hypothetical protein VKU19_27060 [Bryobacteraceae bacterium]|nr:hypothetical protein [Bryobacteraceae bacterium]